MSFRTKGIQWIIATVAMAFVGQVQALTISASSLQDDGWILDSNYWMYAGDTSSKGKGKSNGTLHAPDVENIVDYDPLSLYYKAERDEGKESGNAGFIGSYSTTFSKEQGLKGFNNALIEYNSGPSISCPECYLLIKDGNEPQYIFRINQWDGLEDLMVKDFYPEAGSISHVAIFGNAVSSVPEPSALILMGLGLIGLGMARRRVAR